MTRHAKETPIGLTMKFNKVENSSAIIYKEEVKEIS